MCELIVQVEERLPKRVNLRIHIRDGEGVTDVERRVAVAVSDSLNRGFRVTAQLSSLAEQKNRGDLCHEN